MPRDSGPHLREDELELVGDRAIEVLDELRDRTLEAEAGLDGHREKVERVRKVVQDLVPAPAAPEREEPIGRIRPAPAGRSGVTSRPTPWSRGPRRIRGQAREQYLDREEVGGREPPGEAGLDDAELNRVAEPPRRQALTQRRQPRPQPVEGGGGLDAGVGGAVPLRTLSTTAASLKGVIVVPRTREDGPRPRRERDERGRREPRRMRFLRLRRRPQLDLAALERLADTLRRTAALLEERVAASRPAPAAPVSASPEPPRAPARSPLQPQEFVLFVPTPAGYRLTVADGPVPERGELLGVEEEWYRVLRVGPSPLPGDRRPCVFLEPYAATLN